MKKLFCTLALSVCFLIGFGGLYAASAQGSVDMCVEHKLWTFNDTFGLWVEDNTMFRCVEIGGRLELRTGSAQGISANVPANAANACRGKAPNEIVVEGKIQFTDDRRYNGGFWERECLVLGDVFAGNTERKKLGLFGDDTAIRKGIVSFDGKDLLKKKPNDPSFGIREDQLDIKGISKEGDLRTLIIGFTNFILPYVSVLSVFAIVVSGFYYISSFANDELHSKAKNALVYVLIGVTLVFSAIAIVNVLLTAGGG